MIQKKILKKVIVPTVIAAAILLGPGFIPRSHSQGLPNFVRGSKVCAINVNRLRASLGLSQTHSPAAISFLKLRRVSQPSIGTVRFNWRKGGAHVAVYAGHGMCWNPSSRHQRWMLKPCASIWRGMKFQWRR